MVQEFMMKRFLGILAALALAAFAPGCDDGPSSNYSPLPDGVKAANGGAGQPVSDLFPKQKLGSSTAGSSPLIRCTPEKRRKVWATELAKPMIPVRGAAGLDGTKNLTYTGLSIDEVETALCQGDDGGTGLTFFGEQAELQVNWSTSTRLVTEFDMVTGYRGTMDFTDPVTKDKFSISLEGKPIQRNGQPMHWNWRDQAQITAQTTLLSNAMMRVFMPGVIPQAGDTDCSKTGRCVVEVLDNVDGVFAIFPLGLLQVYFDLGIDDPIARDIVTRIYIPIQKTFDFSNLPFLARLPGTLEQDGAQVFGKVGTKQCVAKPGVTFGAFRDNCVAVTGNSGKDAATTAKFLSGLRHSSESFFIDVVGIDPTFLSDHVRKSTVVATLLDTDRPADNDVLQTLTVDQQLAGPVVNEYPDEDPTQQNDNHGSGLVNLAYAILVQNALDAADTTGRTKHPIGDPNCKITAAGLPATPAATGCTGMEGYITAADPASAPGFSTVALGADAIGLTTTAGLSPAGNQLATWDDSPGNKQYRDAAKLTWAGSAKRIIKVLGKGERLNVPNEFREPRKYATLWMQALTQYLIARGNVGKAVTLNDVLAAGPGGSAAHHIDPNYFFFDTGATGDQQFDTAEYVYTDFATVDRPFYDFKIVVDAVGGILNQLTFDGFPLRGERALLGAVTPAGQPLGGATCGAAPGSCVPGGMMLQTNLFGSTTLSNGWHDPDAPDANFKTAYDCASADFEKLAGAQLASFNTVCAMNQSGDLSPPTDANGKIIRNTNGEPILKPYRGGFASTSSVFNLGRNILSIPQDQIQVKSTDVNLLQATVAFKTKTNPLNPASADGPLMTFPINYILPTDFTGFFIPINASRDRFVKEEEFFTTGIAISTSIGTVPVLVNGQPQPGINRLASADSSDFLGEAFVCKSGGDLLAVRMFTPADAVLEWINAHPKALADCNLIIDYSPFGGVLGRVTAIANGVIVNFSDPSGITAQANNSVVSDVDVFATGL
jgi:hypothetical protein